MSTKRMEQVELRIRWLIDYLWRSYRGVSSVVTSSADPTIDPQLLFRWDKYMAPVSSVETWFRYCVAYQRNVPK